MPVTTLENLPENSAAARDHASQQKRPKVQDMFVKSQETSNRGVAQMKAEIAAATKGPGKISSGEYFRYQMYNHGKSERKEFISDRLNWPIHDIINDLEVAKKTESKWLCTTILESADISTIPISAVINASEDTSRELRWIQSADALGKYLSSAELPLFAKPDNLLGSFGAMRIDAYSDGVVSANGIDIPLSEFFDEHIAGVEYIIQPLITNHVEIDKFTSGLATIRTMNFLKGQEVRMSNALYKLPAAGNIADNFWREGNLLTNIDVDTGQIDKAVSGFGPYQISHERHPTTQDELVGLQLPYWAEVQELNRQSCLLFPELPYQTLDIAITDDGPIVVELNSGGSFDLPQVVNSKGFLTPENKDFFEKHGVNFRKWKPKDFGL